MSAEQISAAEVEKKISIRKFIAQAMRTHRLEARTTAEATAAKPKSLWRKALRSEASEAIMSDSTASLIGAKRSPVGEQKAALWKKAFKGR